LQVPVAFVHGAADRFIDVRDAAQLHDAAPEPKLLLVAPDMGHAFGPLAISRISDATTWMVGAPVH
jgi:fermentation-respiration switch protein FrsA (DUF1100 family)